MNILGMAEEWDRIFLEVVTMKRSSMQIIVHLIVKF